MPELIKNSEPHRAWYPTPINKLDAFLGKTIVSTPNFPHVYALRKNIAYNLQYLQFQHRVILDIKMSSVLWTQSIKSFITFGSSIIESVLHYLLIKEGKHSTTIWEEDAVFKGNEKKYNGERIRIDTTVLKKKDAEELKHMTFDSMIKCAKDHQIFGNYPELYETLERIRTLRNKVHLQLINHPSDTDWNSFQRTHLSDISKLLYAIFVHSVFAPTPDEIEYFEFLPENFIT